MPIKRIILCASCREHKEYFAKGMCSRCYRREQKRVQRGSKLADTSIFDVQRCSYKNCTRDATSRLGFPMCAEHHDECYHREEGVFASFNCTCVNPAATL